MPSKNGAKKSRAAPSSGKKTKTAKGKSSKASSKAAPRSKKPRAKSAAPSAKQPKQAQTRRNIKKHIDLDKVRVIPHVTVKKVKHEWMEVTANGQLRKMLPDDVIDICPGCDDGPVRWSDIRNKRKAGPSSTALTCNRQALGRCDYSGAMNRSNRRQQQGGDGKKASTKPGSAPAGNKRRPSRPNAAAERGTTKRIRAAATAAKTAKTSKPLEGVQGRAPHVVLLFDSTATRAGSPH